LFTIADMKAALAFFAGDPILTGICEDTDNLGDIYVTDCHTGDGVSSGYAKIESDDTIAYGYHLPNNDRIVTRIPGACPGLTDKYLWRVGSHTGALTGYEIERVIYQYFQGISETAQRTLHDMVAVGTFRDIDPEGGATCGSYPITETCGSPISLSGPTVITSAGVSGFTGAVGNPEETCSTGSGAYKLTSVDGDGPYYMILRGTRYPFGGGLVWKLDAADTWVHQLGPNGYAGMAWCGAVVDGTTYLLDYAGNILLTPGDYYANDGYLGYTEGFPGSDSMMFNIVRYTEYASNNRPYALWTEDGGVTWVEKTALIRAALVDGGLAKNWKPGAFHGAELYRYDYNEDIFS